MCELFAVSTAKKMKVNEPLDVFFSHSVEHKNGWGLALLDSEPVFFKKEAKTAIESEFLKELLKDDIFTDTCIAHIRKATIGDVNVKNSHPFLRKDSAGREWILSHNGTIFESDILDPYQYRQEGTTDSERIILCLIDKINEKIKDKGRALKPEERTETVEDLIYAITPGNKVNLLIYDGEFLYVHKNEAASLYQKKKEDGFMISTRPLGTSGWEECPDNSLLVFRQGEMIYTGSPHGNTYVHDERRMQMLYLNYSGL